MTDAPSKRRKVATAACYGTVVCVASLVSWGSKSTSLVFAVREADDLAKFVTEACKGPNPFVVCGPISAEIGGCLDWMTARSPEEACAFIYHIKHSWFELRLQCMRVCLRSQVNKARGQIIEQISEIAQKLQDEGATEAWFSQADSDVRKVMLVAIHIMLPPPWLFSQVSKGVNGPLMKIRAKWSGYHDASCIDTFRKGGNVVGFLACSGNGEAIRSEESLDLNELWKEREETNRLVCV